MSPKSASEFLTIHFNPQHLITSLQSNPSELLCDPAKFDTSFYFPSGVDVATIQHDLCAAATNHSLVMDQVWKLFDMKQLMVELSRLTGATAPTTPVAESPFRMFLKQAQRLLKNANVITRLMQAFSKDMPDVSQYLTMVLTTVNTMLTPDSNNIGGMCDAVVNLIDGVPQYQQAEFYLVRVEVINSIAAKAATSLDMLDEFLCEFPSMNMSTLINKVLDSDVLEELMLMGNQEYLKNKQFVCSNMVRDVMVQQTKLTNMIRDAVNNSYDRCIRKIATENITLITDVNSYLGLLGGMRDLLNSESLATLRWLDPLRPLINSVVDGLVGEVSS